MLGSIHVWYCSYESEVLSGIVQPSNTTSGLLNETIVFSSLIYIEFHLILLWGEQLGLVHQEPFGTSVATCLIKTIPLVSLQNWNNAVSFTNAFRRLNWFPYLLGGNELRENMVHKYINNPFPNYFKDKYQLLTSIRWDNIRWNAKGNMSFPEAGMNFDKTSLVNWTTSCIISKPLTAFQHLDWLWCFKVELSSLPVQAFQSQEK